MKVIIAEKPSVAQQIAAVVGATARKDGYIEGGGYAVTWAFGHLVGPAMPEAYGIEGFKRENLPILPETFVLEPRRVKSGKEYKPDPGAVKQLAVLKELFPRAERIVVATDAGREGELIFRFIYHYLDCKTPFDRLWISSLTERAIREGLAAIRPGSEWCVGAIWQIPRSRRRPISGSNSTRPKTLRRSPSSRRRNTIRKRRRTKPVPQSGAATACRLRRSSVEK